MAICQGCGATTMLVLPAALGQLPFKGLCQLLCVIFSACLSAWNMIQRIGFHKSDSVLASETYAGCFLASKLNLLCRSAVLSG